MKITGISTIINIVLMAVVDVLMYIFIKDWTNTAICSIIIVDLAFILNICSFVFVPKHKNSYIFQTSSSIMTSILIVIEIVLMIIGVFLTDILDEPYVMIVEIVLFILFTLLFITNTIANKHTAQTADVNDEGITRITNITSRLEVAFKRAQNTEVKKLIEKAYDKSHSITSFKAELQSYDEDLIDLADSISNMASSNNVIEVEDLCNRFISLVDERQIKARQLQN